MLLPCLPCSQACRTQEATAAEAKVARITILAAVVRASAVTKGKTLAMSRVWVVEEGEEGEAEVGSAVVAADVGTGSRQACSRPA